MNYPGKFIVIYGINNLGKTTQAKFLVEKLNAEGRTAEYLKYPIYDLEPAGPIINEYLRGGNPHQITPRELQTLHVLNRTQYEPTFKERLTAGTTVIAEDYVGTGMAWGMGAGVDEEYLAKLNAHLLKEDIAFLFDGERFTESTEENHTHETDSALLKKVRAAHLHLAHKYDWHIINANASVEEIHQTLLEKLSTILL